MFTPTISGTLGSQWGFDDDYVTYGMAWGEEEYLWWNAGLSLTVEKFTMDFRYWDTNLGGAENGNCDTSSAGSFECGATLRLLGQGRPALVRAHIPDGKRDPRGSRFCMFRR